MKKTGFTLAEVLITLGIIGVVAAISIPVLVQKHNNLVVEGRLAKFYRDVNSAIQLSELENGDRKNWTIPSGDASYETVDGVVTLVSGEAPAGVWFKEYIMPYMNVVKVKNNAGGIPIFYFGDGSAFVASHPSGTISDWLFFPGDPEKCYPTIFEDPNYIVNPNKCGICAFLFAYYPWDDAGSWKYHFNKGFEPYAWNWNGDEEALVAENREDSCSKNSKGNFCTKLIQLNGWKIPKNYPRKVTY